MGIADGYRGSAKEKLSEFQDPGKSKYLNSSRTNPKISVVYPRNLYIKGRKGLP